jgi:ADP-ribosyl-[dinitrogen reductase] hydrolase
MNIRGKILGALYGFAIGDSMGATTEFMTPKMIQMQYGQVDDLIGGGWLNTKPGEVTDDTQMSICIINALNEMWQSYPLINYDLFRTKVMDKFVEWYKTGPKDVGGQCSKAINYYMITGEFISEDTNAQGNGSLMRALPIALLGMGALELNLAQGKLTHNNIICQNILYRYMEMVNKCLEGEDVKVRYDKDVSPNGYVVNTFECVKRHFAEARDFESGIINAVNEGGDADTIAAITGGLLGAKFGYDYIPPSWIEKLDGNVKLILNDYAEKVCKER